MRHLNAAMFTTRIRFRNVVATVGLGMLALLLQLAGCSSPPSPGDPARRAGLQTGIHTTVRLERALETDAGAVACVDRYAAQVGAELLARGGNAVDAAVGTALALAVTWPQAGNLGGGGFMIVRMADGRQISIDARETAPAAFPQDAFLDESGSYDPARASDPWLAIGVPGSVAGLGAAHERFGLLTWAEVVGPAIELARRGFVRDEMFCRYLTSAAAELNALPSSRAIFLNADGTAPAVGTRLTQYQLARTLEVLAAEGSSAFYTGPLAEGLVRDVQAAGGLLTLDDLASYQVLFREPLLLEFAGRTVLAMPPPSSGGVALGQILGQLERVFSPATDGQADAAPTPGSLRFLHHYAEAARRAFAERARWLGDPDFVPVPTERLLHSATLDALAASIDSQRATASQLLGPPLTPQRAVPESEETTHISVIDADGNAVSFTTTLEATYGSKAVSASTGILLNNQLGDFNRIPGQTTVEGHIGTPANLAAPGKRPLSSMSPVIVLDGEEVVLVTGSPGGRTIINTVAQVVLAHLLHGMPLADAVNAPRVHHQWHPDSLSFESVADWPSTEVRQQLEAMGHRLDRRPDTPPSLGRLGAAHSVARDPASGRITAVGDQRRDGWAASDN